MSNIDVNIRILKESFRKVYLEHVYLVNRGVRALSFLTYDNRMDQYDPDDENDFNMRHFMKIIVEADKCHYMFTDFRRDDSYNPNQALFIYRYEYQEHLLQYVTEYEYTDLYTIEWLMGLMLEFEMNSMYRFINNCVLDHTTYELGPERPNVDTVIEWLSVIEGYESVYNVLPLDSKSVINYKLRHIEDKAIFVHIPSTEVSDLVDRLNSYCFTTILNDYEAVMFISSNHTIDDLIKKALSLSDHRVRTYLLTRALGLSNQYYNTIVDHFS